jgi:hypothetical protein
MLMTAVPPYLSHCQSAVRSQYQLRITKRARAHVLELTVQLDHALAPSRSLSATI